MKSFEGLELEEAVENLTFIRKYFEDTRLLELHSTRLKSYEKEEEDILDELPEVFDAELTEKNYEKFFEGLYLA